MKALLRDALRGIGRTAGRFAAIALMTALGCGFFSGLSAASPAMMSSATEYIEGCSLMDLRLRSNIGVKSSEIAAVRQAEGVSGACAWYTKELYYNGGGRSIVVKAFSIPENIAADSRHFLNRPYVAEGRLPQAPDECAVELKATSPGEFRVGESITLSSPDPENDPLSDTLSRDTFRIVGVVVSPMFIGYERDSAAVGDGDVNSNIYIPETDFTCDYYTDMFVTLDIPDRSEPFSEGYRREVESRGEPAEEAFEQSVGARYDKLISDAEKKLKAAQSTIDRAEGVLSADSGELARMVGEARQTLEETKALYGGSDNLLAKASVANAEKQLRMLTELAEDESGEVRARYRAELDSAYGELAESREQLAAAPTLKVYRDDRFSFGDYGSYSSDAERIAKLALAFPPFFALVAALVCMNAMSRMTAEQRTAMGVCKALGYSDGAVFLRFAVYGTSAALIGAAGGAALGMAVIPRVVMGAYSALYNIPAAGSTFVWQYLAASAAVSVLLVNVSAYFSCRRALKENAGDLMRPEPPRAGKRILAERVKPLWNRLGFISKSALRNISRYKRRALMTVIGAAGSTALMIAGFGLRETINSVLDRQFGEIFVYSAAAALDGAEFSAEELLESEPRVTACCPAVMKNVYAGDASADKLCGAYLMAAEGSPDGLVTLRTGGGEHLAPVNGAVVTEKLAKLCGLSEGGSIDIKTPEGVTRSVTVEGITENYALNFVYMRREVYARVFGDESPCSAAYLRFAEGTDSGELKRELIAREDILGVTLIGDTVDSFADSTKAMDSVVLLMLLCAMMLAVTVLFGLTDISITERRRELATVRVLGFYDGEVKAFISREMLLLTAAGLPVGMMLGRLLHSFAVKSVEVDALMYPEGLSWKPYIFGAALTMIFALIVDAALTFKLKKIEMAETLKSVE